MSVVFLALLQVCRPPAAVEDFRRTLPADPDLRRAAVEERLQKTPDEFFLHRLYLEPAPYTRQRAVDRYRRLFQEYPNDINYTYLYARALVGRNTPEALRLFQTILEKDPAYPWVHLTRLEIYRSNLFRDLSKLRASFTAFLEVCPESVEPYRYLRHVEDKELAVKAAGRLRALLAKTNDPEDLALFSDLWSAEFRVNPPSEHDRLRKQVIQDLQRVKSDRRALQTAARLTADKQLEQAAKQPRSATEEFMTWQREHPHPREAEPSEKVRSYALALLAASDGWRQAYPEDPLGHQERLNALVLLDETTPADIDAAANAALAVARRHPSLDRLLPAPHRVAWAFVQRGIFLDRVPALIAEAIQRLDDPEVLTEMDLYEDPRRAATRMAVVNSHINAWDTLVAAYLGMKQPDRVRETLRVMGDYLSAKAPGVEEKDAEALRAYAAAQSSLYRRMASFAESEGRQLDASQYRRQAHAVLSGVPSFPRSTIPAWTQADRPLPDFDLRDTTGKQWRLADLKGKTTLLNVWATWCPPCHQELPYLQKLQEKLRDQPGIQVITLNVDDNPGLVEPLLGEGGYRFPVLLAKFYIEKLLPSLSIPRNWIIDKDGVLRQEQIGFGGDGEVWVGEVLRKLTTGQ
jgi:thiol-disulfide isomerase/thioredoxin